jgi:putative ABC transport system permease protein
MIIRTNFNLIIRKWKRNKIYSVISISSLAIGLACINLFIAFIINEWQISVGSVDNDRIFLLQSDNPTNIASDEKTLYMRSELHPILKERYPEIENYCRFQDISWNSVFRAEEFKSTQMLLLCADTSITEFFPIPLIAGDIPQTLSSPNEAAISMQTALKVFGRTDVLGQSFSISTLQDESNFTITSIIDNSATQSFLKYDILLPINNKTFRGGVTFVRLDKESSKEKILSKMKKDKELLPRLSEECQYYLQPISEAYYDTSEILQAWKFIVHRDKSFINIGILAALCILLISCFNYINMYMAQLLKSEKSIGLQSLLGADKAQLRFHLFFETSMTILIGFLFSIGLVIVMMPTINSIFDAHVTSNFLFSKWVLLYYIVLMVLLTIIPSAYLFFKLKQKPLTLLNRHFIPHRKTQFTNGMVVVQTIISIILIVGTIVYSKQLSYIAETANIDNNLIEIKANNLPTEKLKAFKDEIISLPNIGAGTISASSYLTGIVRTYEDHSQQTLYAVDNDFITTHNLSLIYGEDFTTDFNSNKNKVIVNETYIKSNSIVDPIGKPLSAKEPNKTISGVVADFYNEPFSNRVKPITIYPISYYPYSYGQVLQLRLDPNNFPQTISVIQNKWQTFFPDRPFDYDFIKDKFESLHIKHAKTATMIRFFSLISIFLTAFGLFGLISYSTKKRTKEIGIRKVNGARISEVLVLLNKDFVKWVIIAFVIATPIAYYAMHKWLENFAYKTELSWWIFALAGVLALGIALLTVSFQSWKAATKNPVESLRYE